MSCDPRPHIDALDVVRPLAAIAVISTHSVEYFGYNTSLFYGAAVVESQASRHVFFFVAALVLTYQAYDRPRWSAPAFWGRRFVSVCVPYLVWTVVYFLLGFLTVMQGGLTVPSVTGSPLQALEELGKLAVTGAGHLYFVMVLVQFYILFPAFVWLLRRTRGNHLAVLAISFTIQVGLTICIHYVGLNGSIWYDINPTREITSYQFYLVAGALTGAHLPAVRQWVRRHWLPLAAAAVTVAIGTEAWYVLAVRLGNSPLTASDPFSPEYIPSYLADILLLCLLGEWWATRQRDGRFSRLIRAASDNSFGVYLSQAVFIDLALALGLGGLKPGVPWYVLSLAALVITWTGASLLAAILARTPVSRWTVGRARRPVAGGPPPVGRGTKGLPASQDRQWPAPSLASSR